MSHPGILNACAAQDLREVINYSNYLMATLFLVWLQATAKAPAHHVCLLARWDESTRCDTWQDGVKGR